MYTVRLTKIHMLQTREGDWCRENRSSTVNTIAGVHRVLHMFVSQSSNLIIHTNKNRVV